MPFQNEGLICGQVLYAQPLADLDFGLVGMGTLIYLQKIREASVFIYPSQWIQTAESGPESVYTAAPVFA